MRQRLKTLISEQLGQGTTPQSLAKATAVGIVIGNFPIWGATTPLCLAAGYALRLNQPLLQIINYMVSPSQLLMMPVFVHIGEWLTGAPHQTFDFHIVMTEFSADKVLFFKHFGMAAVHAMIAWALVAPLFGLFIYAIANRVYLKIAVTHKR